MANPRSDTQKPRAGKLEGAKVDNKGKNRARSNTTAGQMAGQPSRQQSGDPNVKG